MRISDWSSDVCSSDLESFERIHRSNLVGMGVLPLQFVAGVDRKTLGLTGEETFTIQHVAALKPRQTVDVIVTRADRETDTFKAPRRIDTANEVEIFFTGGSLPSVLRKLAGYRQRLIIIDNGNLPDGEGAPAR